MSASPTTPSETVIAERYELRRRLAQGGMAEVWLAVDLTLDRKVAVKWLKPVLASDEVVAERFRREAIAAASLSHPNIVAVHDVFEHEGRQAVVMQLVDGKSLRQLLDTQKRLSPELTAHIGACTAAALHHAHQNNFVHRDVKPGNIMITPDGRVLLTDFGIAKALGGGDDLTSDNIMMGTAKYLSPEQVRGKKLDGRADLYSLGLVLYECLAGRVPFLGETDADTALARLQRDPTDLARLRATLPTGLVTVIHQLLARNPAHRPATGAALVEALESAGREGAPEIDATPHERSPVAPFSAGRLRRAPSDLDGRADDRRRGARATGAPAVGDPGDASPVSAPSRPATGSPRDAPTTAMPPRGRIPGEPGHVATADTTTRDTAHGTARDTLRSNQRVRRTPERARDDTPAAGGAQRGRPAKGLSQSWRPSLTIIGGLLLLAAIVAVVLWMSVRFGAGETTAPSTVVPSGDVAADADADATAATGAPSDAGAPDAGATEVGPATITALRAFDPDGDGEENGDEAPAAIADGDPTTTWRTVCYSDQYMGGKGGVGLVVSLDGPGRQPLSVDVVNGPYQLEFYATSAEAIPTTINAWGPRLGPRAASDTAGVVVSERPAAPVRHLLVLLLQLGPDAECSEANPFRGRLGEIALVD